MSDIGVNLTAIDSTAQFKPGTVVEVTDSDGYTKKYRYIKYLEGTAATAGVAGEVAYYVKPATDTTGTVATSDISDTDSIGAGVLQAALTDATYGWVQVTGVATMSIALTAGADGNALCGNGAGDGTLDVSAAVTDSVCAYAIDASAKIIMCAFPH